MVFIPVGCSHEVFRPALTGWEAVRDGAPPGPAPHTIQSSVDFACEILTNFQSLDGHRIQYKKGMQGHYLGEGNSSQGLRMAKIYIEGITEHGPESNERNKWVPYDKIKIGPAWPSSTKDWVVELPKIPKIRLTHPSSNTTGTTDLLRPTITSLINALVNNPPPFPNLTFLALVKRYGAEDLSRIILRGMQQAGVYEILSRNDFTYQELRDAATYKIDEDRGHSKRGIYMRCQKSKSNLKYWKPSTRYAYVGKTETSFSSRYRGHPTGTHRYACLNRGSTELISFALCILDVGHERDIYHLAEQILLCMMGTYRSDLISTNVSGIDPGDRFHTAVMNARYFWEVSKDVFQSTEYVQPLSRQSFGIDQGANTSSPMDEIARFEQVSFLRTDSVFRDHIAQESVPVAENRREKPIKAHWSKNAVGARSELNLFGISAETGSKTAEIHRFDMSAARDEIDGIAYPTENTACQVVSEVRLDGKPIKNSWARLPRIAIWVGWEQANSFAVRVEWEYPKGSGMWRFRYAQTTRLYSMADTQIPGSLARFAKAMGTLSWLFQVKLVCPDWIIKPAYFIRVRQIEYDFMSQTIRLAPPTKMKPLVAVTRHSPSNIARQMAEAGVDGKEEDCESTARRVKCDLCYFLMRGASETHTRHCVKEGDGTLCAKCREWGLPFCPWKSLLPTLKARLDKTGVTLDPDHIALYDKAEAILFTMPKADTGIMTYKQELLVMKRTDQMDNSDEESGDED